jgi:hypothetical protein
MTDEELSVKGPGGIGLSFKGPHLFPVILMLVLAGIFGVLFYQAETKADVRQWTIVSTMNKLSELTEKAEATQRSMIYVLTLSQAEREKLALLKPKELREMQRRD